jgi:hypothetical protein
MRNHIAKKWPIVRAGLASALVWTVLSAAGPAFAQQTMQQFNDTNAENRRYTDMQNQLRGDLHQQRMDQRNGAIACQSMGAGQGACQNQLNFNNQQQGLALHGQRLQQRQTHMGVLRGITGPAGSLTGTSVRPQP